MRRAASSTSIRWPRVSPPGVSAKRAAGRLATVLNLVNEITREPIENSARCAPSGAAATARAADHSVLITRSGQEVAIQESAAPICDRQGRVIGAVIVFHDVTKERRLKRALSYQASHDALTGLINRREFDNRLHARAALRAQRGEGTLRAALHRSRSVQGRQRHLRPPGRRPAAARRDRTAADARARLRHHRAPGRRRVRRAARRAARSSRRRASPKVCARRSATTASCGARSTLSVGASVGVVQITRRDRERREHHERRRHRLLRRQGRGPQPHPRLRAEGVSHRHREMHWVARVTRAAEENRLELFFQPIVPLGAQRRARLPRAHRAPARR